MTPSQLDADRNHILEKTAGLWDALKSERVFITGGTGFVGSWLLEAFAAANSALRLNARALLLTRDPARFCERYPHLAGDPAIECVEGDAASFAAPHGTFAFTIHAATEPSFAASAERPLGVVAPDLRATENVLRVAADCGTRRFLFTSSGAVYGRGDDAARLSETYRGAPDPLHAAAAYGESKRLSEFAVTSYGRVFGFETSIARLFAFVGPNLPLDRGYAVGNFIGDVLAGRSIAIAGDGTARRSYLYAADMAIWLWTILLRGENGRAYNVGSPDDVSIEALARTVASTLAPQTEVVVAGKPTPGAAPSRYVPDVERAQSELGLRAWIDLPEALARTHAYYTNSTRRNVPQ
jgi:dTDP-glucose 4,6-dehydratase